MDNIADKLSDIKGSSLEAIRVMEIMGLSSVDLIEPSRFLKFKEIVEKLDSVPNKEFLLKKLTLKRVGTDILNVVWEYLKMQEKRELYQEELDKINQSKDILVKFSEEKGIDPSEIEDYAKHLQQISEFQSTIRNIDEEISLYEN